MPLPVCETPELLLECDAARIGIRWRGQVTRVVKAEHAAGGVRVTVIIEPDTRGIPVVGTIDAEPKPLSECQRDILDVLRGGEGRRISRQSIIDTLEDSGKIHGESTICIALPELARRGYVDAPVRGVKKGYAITSKGLNTSIDETPKS